MQMQWNSRRGLTVTQTEHSVQGLETTSVYNQTATADRRGTNCETLR